MRRHFFRRIAIAFAVFFAFVFVMGWLSVVLFHGGAGGAGRPSFFPAFLVILALVVGFVSFGRAVRRMAGPIGDVMDAAARVANGDYAARAPVRGPREVRELAASFNDMAERIEASELQRRNLLADLTHELRTPLAVIRGRVEGMLDGLYPPDEVHLGLVARQTEVLARLLDDLQTLSKAEAGALDLHRARADAGELVEGSVSAYRTQAEGAGVDLVAEVADDLGELDVDRVRIGEVLSNLVTNALRYTPARGRITVSASRAPEGIAFAVSDTGPGIPPDALPHVFDRFAKSSESRGAGLGLAIARTLVRAHGGTISAESSPSGTTIRFLLPTDVR